jgi:hypothetical protein
MDVVYAMDSAVVAMPDGSQVHVRKDSTWPADDPVVTQVPRLFSGDPRGVVHTSDGLPPVETATAAPGERRNVRR